MKTMYVRIHLLQRHGTFQIEKRSFSCKAFSAETSIKDRTRLRKTTFPVVQMCMLWRNQLFVPISQLYEGSGQDRQDCGRLSRKLLEQNARAVFWEISDLDTFAARSFKSFGVDFNTHVWVTNGLSRVFIDLWDIIGWLEAENLNQVNVAHYIEHSSSTHFSYISEIRIIRFQRVLLGMLIHSYGIVYAPFTNKMDRTYDIIKRVFLDDSLYLVYLARKVISLATEFQLKVRSFLQIRKSSMYLDIFPAKISDFPSAARHRCDLRSLSRPSVFLGPCAHILPSFRYHLMKMLYEHDNQRSFLPHVSYFFHAATLGSHETRNLCHSFVQPVLRRLSIFRCR